MVLKKKPVSRQYDSISREILRDAVLQFDVGELHAAHTLVIEGDRVVILSEKSETSRKYVIDTSTGRYFLKEVPWYCDEAPYRDFSRRLMNHLAAANLPVPRVIRAGDGNWSVPVADSNFVLLEYRPGAPYRRTDQHVVAAAEVLARLHRESAKLQVPDDAPREDTASIVNEHFELAHRLRPARSGAGRIFQALRELAGSTLSAVSRTQVIPVHGDYIPWNLAFAADGSVSGVHDFDNACMDSALHDLGEALSSFFLVPHAGVTAILRPISENPDLPVVAMSRFLARYRRERPLSDEDLAALRLTTIGAWWESILLSYIRGDQAESCFEIMTRYPRHLSASWNEVIDRSTEGATVHE